MIKRRNGMRLAALIAELEANTKLIEIERGKVIDRLRDSLREMINALQQLHDNVDEYQRINHLGGHDNQDMQMAREALATAKPLVGDM